MNGRISSGSSRMPVIVDSDVENNEVRNKRWEQRDVVVCVHKGQIE
jgi:hypothetical protein